MKNDNRFTRDDTWDVVMSPIASLNQEGNPLVIELRRQLQNQLRINSIQLCRVKQLEAHTEQKRCLELKVSELQKELDEHFEEKLWLSQELQETQRTNVELLHINKKQTWRGRELVQQKEALEVNVEELQKQLNKRHENLQVPHLCRQLQEAQKSYQVQLHISNALKWIVMEQMKEVQQNKDLVQELQEQLCDAKEEKEEIIEFGMKLFNKTRQGVNEFVEDLYKENKNLKTIALRKQAEVEEMEHFNQCLQEQVETLNMNNYFYSVELECANDTIEKQEVAMMNMRKELVKYKALSKLHEVTEEAESKDFIPQNEFQKDQSVEELQATMDKKNL